MTIHWGADSVSQVTPSLASTVRNFSGGSVDFWARYLTPSPGSPLNVAPASEAQALRSYGMHWIVPISAPGEGRINQGSAEGNYDGTRFCDNLAAVLNSGAGIYLPTQRHDNYGNPILRVYLDIEYGATLTQSYWNGWATAVSNYYYGGHYPFFPCAYCAPTSDPTNQQTCYVLGGNSGSNICHGIWSSQPEPCSVAGACHSPGPAWGPYGCSTVVGGTKLWQYAEDGGCRNICGSAAFYDFDLDESTPANGDDETYYMLYVP
jgi:hypothetical protein